MEQKILIVDDEAHIRMLIEQTLEELEDEGVTFFTAENGEQAMACVEAARSSACMAVSASRSGTRPVARATGRGGRRRRARRPAARRAGRVGHEGGRGLR